MTPDRIDQQQDEIVAKSRAILARADAENRDLTDAEVAEIDDATAAFDRLNRQRASIERAATMFAGEQSLGRKAGPIPVGRDAFGVRPGPRGDSNRWGARGYQARANSAYVAMFGQPAGDMAGFQDARELFSVVASGRYDPRLDGLKAAHRTDIAESAGVFLPSMIASGLLDDTVETSTVFKLVRRVPVQSKHTTFPYWAMADRSAGLLHGMAGRWIAEGGEESEQTGKASQLSVTTNKLGIYTSATAELLADSPMFSASLQPAMASAAAYSLDRAIIRGTGVNQPLGLLNAPSAITIAKESGQANSSLLFLNVVKLYSSLYPAGLARSTWLAHPTLVPALITLKDYALNAAGSEHVSGEAVLSMDAQGNMRLLGRPIALSEHVPSLGNEGDLMLADMSQYCWFARQDVSLDVSNAPGWHSDTVSLRLLLRGTGMPLWESVATRPNSGGTESWLVKLGARQ